MEWTQQQLEGDFRRLPPFLQEHSRRVGRLARIFAECLSAEGYLPEDISETERWPEEMEVLGLYHDIGKAAIYTPVWTSTKSLSPAERRLVQAHPLMGEYLVRGCLLPAGADEGTTLRDRIARCCKYHHERWDGTGYPYGLAGKQIPAESRMMALADSYDAMTELRPYHKGMSKKAALEEITRCSGTQFDPEFATLFCRLLREGKG